MKKFAGLLLIMLAVLFLVGCSANSEPAESSDLAQEELTVQTDTLENQNEDQFIAEEKNNQMKLQIGDNQFTATLADNSSAAALKEILENGPLTIDMRDFGNMEKVGSLGRDLPENNQQITTEAGDLILYQRSAFVIYYAPNSWNFTRLGKIDNVTQEELKEALGTGSVSVTLSIN